MIAYQSYNHILKVGDSFVLVREHDWAQLRLTGAELEEFENDWATCLAYEQTLTDSNAWELQFIDPPYVANGITFDKPTYWRIYFPSEDQYGSVNQTLDECANILVNKAEMSVYYKWLPRIVQDPDITYFMSHWVDTFTNENIANQRTIQVLKANGLFRPLDNVIVPSGMIDYNS
jgi:hypothetical protein